MSNMFSRCTLLRVLNLSNFNTDNAKYLDGIISKWTYLENLNCSDTSIIAYHLKNIKAF